MTDDLQLSEANSAYPLLLGLSLLAIPISYVASYLIFGNHWAQVIRFIQVLWLCRTTGESP